MVGPDIDASRDLDLAGKQAVIVGAAQGIGAAVARKLAGLGMSVVLADRQDCAAAAKECGQRATAAFVDMAQPATIDALIAGAAENGPIHGVVNCAGLLVRTPLEEVDETVMQREIAVNQTGVFYLARAALATIAAQKSGGRIVLFTSQGAFTGGYYGSTTYAMTKAAVGALVKSLARLGAPEAITVNAVAPGAADTAMLRDGMSEADLEAFRQRIPMARFASPDELAGVCAFLLSDWAGYITGSTLHVNGGQYMP